MEKKLSSKYIHMYMSISRVFIRLTGNVLKLFPFAMVICPVGNDSNLLIVFYVQIMPDDFVMQLHRF